jgi:hypothetical protein
MKKNFSPDELNSNTLFEELSERCKGLIYSSETDAPVTVIKVASSGRPVSDVLVESYVSNDATVAVEQQDSELFFAKATRKADWHDQARIDRAETFQELQKLLENNLRSLAVYKFGQVRVDLFVAGLDDVGNVIGIRTAAVET